MIEMENINLIKQLCLDVQLVKESLSTSNSKRWLSTSDLAMYIGYSKDGVNKLVVDAGVFGHLRRSGCGQRLRCG